MKAKYCSPRCKWIGCGSKCNKAWAAKNADRQREHQNRWRTNNMEKVRAQARAAMKRWRDRNKEAAAEKDFDKAIRERSARRKAQSAAHMQSAIMAIPEITRLIKETEGATK